MKKQADKIILNRAPFSIKEYGFKDPKGYLVTSTDYRKMVRLLYYLGYSVQHLKYSKSKKSSYFQTPAFAVDRVIRGIATIQESSRD